jgi:hypothetical protein
MADLGKTQKTLSKKIVLLVYMVLIFFGGILTLRSLLNIPGEESSVIAFGLSGARLILFVAVLAITLFVGVFLSKSVANPSWYSKISTQLIEKLAVDKVFGSILLFSVLGIIIGSNFVTIIPEIYEPVALAYYIRLKPLIWWVVTACSQTILGITLLKFNYNLSTFRKWGRRSYAFIFTFGMISIVGLWISGTGYGLDPIDEGIGWHVLGPPILETQVLAGWGISMAIFFLWSWTSGRVDKIDQNRKKWGDILICTALWLTAFTLWMAQPLKPNWFAAEPRAPNYEFYPNSDSSVYDVTAQNLMLGDGFKTRGSPFTLRPLYTAFLALLHKIGGLEYEPIIWMQVAVLAFIPVVLYTLTKLLYNRFSALLAALLLIFREMNAIKLGDSISDAHAKLLLPFLPTTLGILLFLWLFSTWLQSPTKRPSLAILTGGIAGFFMLIRPEVGAILPFVGLAALLQLRKQPGTWFKGVALISVGLVMAIGPWIWRNYQITGTIYIDSPHYRLDLIIKRYREDPIGFTLPENLPEPTKSAVTEDSPKMSEDDLKDQFAPTELPLAFTPTIEPKNKQTPTPETGSKADEGIQQLTDEMAEDVISYVQQNPDTTTNFILTHLMNSVVQTVLGLPISHPITLSTIKFLGHKSVSQLWLDCCSLEDYERKFQFWSKWDGRLPLISIIPISFNLTLVAIGISSAWRKQKFTSLIPIAAAIGYYMINALVRNSGGRYIIPVNWVAFFYFSIGLAKATSWGISSFKPKAWRIMFSEEVQIDTKTTTFPILNKSNLGIATIILIIGCTLPLLEIAIPQKYAPSVIENRINKFFQEEQQGIRDTEKDYLETFIENGGRVLQGLALYPRYHKPYQMGSVWSIYQERSYSHIDFYLSSPYDTGVVLVLVNEPNYFPSASNVIVFACPHGDYYDALAVILINSEGKPKQIMWRSNISKNASCPLPNP